MTKQYQHLSFEERVVIMIEHRCGKNGTLNTAGAITCHASAHTTSPFRERFFRAY